MSLLQNSAIFDKATLQIVRALRWILGEVVAGKSFRAREKRIEVIVGGLKDPPTNEIGNFAGGSRITM